VRRVAGSRLVILAPGSIAPQFHTASGYEPLYGDLSVESRYESSGGVPIAWRPLSGV
jgi:hypothetical protein